MSSVPLRSIDCANPDDTPSSSTSSSASNHIHLSPENANVVVEDAKRTEEFLNSGNKSQVAPPSNYGVHDNRTAQAAIAATQQQLQHLSPRSRQQHVDKLQSAAFHKKRQQLMTSRRGGGSGSCNDDRGGNKTPSSEASLTSQPQNQYPQLVFSTGASPQLAHGSSTTHRDDLNNPKTDVAYDDVNTIKFSQKFEAGNLARVRKIDEFEYDLEMQGDTTTLCGALPGSTTQWFHFGFTNLPSPGVYTFNIVNFTKNSSLYQYGLKPVLFCRSNKCWRAVGDEVSYFQNFVTGFTSTAGGLASPTSPNFYFPGSGVVHSTSSQVHSSFDNNDRRRFVLRFSIEFREASSSSETNKKEEELVDAVPFVPNDTYFLSYNYPFNYSDMMFYLKSLEKMVEDLKVKRTTKKVGGAQSPNRSSSASAVDRQSNGRVNPVGTTRPPTTPLSTKLQLATTKTKPHLVLKRKVIGHSLLGRTIERVKVYRNDKKLSADKYVVVTARVHPGEVNASWVIKGMLDTLIQMKIPSSSPSSSSVKGTRTGSSSSMSGGKGISSRASDVGAAPSRPRTAAAVSTQQTQQQRQPNGSPVDETLMAAITGSGGATKQTPTTMIEDDPKELLLSALERFKFIFIPMLNPDGVALGNYRSDSNGADLNRCWKGATEEAHPSIAATKAYIRKLQAKRGKEVVMFLDLHGHSKKRGVFLYGNSRRERSVTTGVPVCAQATGRGRPATAGNCFATATTTGSSARGEPEDGSSPFTSTFSNASSGNNSNNVAFGSSSSSGSSSSVSAANANTNASSCSCAIVSPSIMRLSQFEKIFPLLLYRHTPQHFVYSGCTFTVPNEKEGAARVSVWEELGVPLCYTVETSFVRAPLLSGCSALPSPADATHTDDDSTTLMQHVTSSSCGLSLSAAEWIAASSAADDERNGQQTGGNGGVGVGAGGGALPLGVSMTLTDYKNIGAALLSGIARCVTYQKAQLQEVNGEALKVTKNAGNNAGLGAANCASLLEKVVASSKTPVDELLFTPPPPPPPPPPPKRATRNKLMRMSPMNTSKYNNVPVVKTAAEVDDTFVAPTVSPTSAAMRLVKQTASSSSVSSLPSKGVTTPQKYNNNNKKVDINNSRGSSGGGLGDHPSTQQQQRGEKSDGDCNNAPSSSPAVTATQTNHHHHHHTIPLKPPSSPRKLTNQKPITHAQYQQQQQPGSSALYWAGITTPTSTPTGGQNVMNVGMIRGKSAGGGGRSGGSLTSPATAAAAASRKNEVLIEKIKQLGESGALRRDVAIPASSTAKKRTLQRRGSPKHASDKHSAVSQEATATTSCIKKPVEPDLSRDGHPVQETPGRRSSSYRTVPHQEPEGLACTNAVPVDDAKTTSSSTPRRRKEPRASGGGGGAVILSSPMSPVVDAASTTTTLATRKSLAVKRSPRRSELQQHTTTAAGSYSPPPAPPARVTTDAEASAVAAVDAALLSGWKQDDESEGEKLHSVNRQRSPRQKHAVAFGIDDIVRPAGREDNDIITKNTEDRPNEEDVLLGHEAPPPGHQQQQQQQSVAHKRLLEAVQIDAEVSKSSSTFKN